MTRQIGLRGVVYAAVAVLAVVLVAAPRTRNVVGRIGERDLNRVFAMLEKYGREKKADSNWNQFMVAAMMSKKEIEEDSKKWNNDLPVNSNLRKKRVKFYLNREHKDKAWNIDRQLHGEIQLIQNDLGPQGLIKEFHDHHEDNTAVPILMLYSFYIPCAHVKNLGYSCSEQLKVYMDKSKQKIGMVVAFDEIYKGTDEDSSLKFMQDGQIVAYQRMLDGGVRVLRRRKCNPDRRRTKRSLDGTSSPCDTVFQRVLFELLSENLVAYCCTHSSRLSSLITAYAINYAMYDCTNGTAQKGALRDKNARVLKECLNHWIHTSVNNDCRECRLPVNAIQDMVAGSVEAAIGQSKVIGRPTTRDLTRPEWTAFEYGWAAAYTTSPDDFLLSNRLMCGDRMLSPESLCTKRIIRNRA